MKKPNDELTYTNAVDAWSAGLRSIDAGTLVEKYVSVFESVLRIGELEFDLDEIDRIRVVGAGKAGRSMALGLQRAVGVDVQLDKRVSGWINVPGNGSPRTVSSLPTGLPTIWPFAARPVGENLPTEDCYGGTLLMEDIVDRTGQRELCIVLISGGGSALLCHPAHGVRLEDVIKVTRWMSGQGASIQQLNTVRKQISQVKGGRLAARFSGKHMASLILSDVVSGELDLVASGPTVSDNLTAAGALDVLSGLDPKFRSVPRRIVSHLKKSKPSPVTVPESVSNHLIGNIETAIKGSIDFLNEQAFECSTEIQHDEFEEAEEAGKRMAQWIIHRKDTSQQLALVSGGEPVVRVGNSKGRGGRNQHMVLAALNELLKVDLGDCISIALLSGGTDGEDGNTEVAGACIDSKLVRLCRERKLDPSAFLKRYDSHRFFLELGAGSLLRVPDSLQTNVCDLRIVLVSPNPS